MIPTRNISHYPSIDENEGILITKIRTNIKSSEIFIHGKEGRWPLAHFKDVQASEDIRVIKIKSGEAYFSKFFRGKGFVFGPDNYFTIEPKTITYVGDLVVEWVYEEGSVVAHITVIDREAETIAEAKKKYPWIFNEYPYRKNIALYK